MAKSKLTPQQQFANSVARTFRARGNNTAEVAAVFGVSQRTAQRWMQQISAGERDITTPGRAQKYTSSAKETPRYFRGDRGELKETRSTEGKEFRIKDYKIEAGKSLPENDVTKKAWGYQIVITGRDRGKTRSVTTPIADTPSTALKAAGKQMQTYRKFRGSKMFLRVFSKI